MGLENLLQKFDLGKLLHGHFPSKCENRKSATRGTAKDLSKLRLNFFNKGDI